MKLKESKKKAVVVEENDEEKVTEEDSDDGLDLAHDTEIIVSSTADEANSTSQTVVKTAAAHSFVNLVDVFPPLPAKGSFSVETIKKSLYFFS